MEPETDAEKRARLLADLETVLAQRPPAIEDGGWQYPPAPEVDAPPEPPLSAGALILLGTILAVIVLAVAITVP